MSKTGSIGDRHLRGWGKGQFRRTAYGGCDNVVAARSGVFVNKTDQQVWS